MLSASTTDYPATVGSGASPAVTRGDSRAWWQVPAKHFYIGLIVVSLIVGALSLLIPSTPSYDPWAWIVWGREIVHLKLHTTGGPSWKPLPMLFTVPFAVFGNAEPNLWLVIARAGAFAAVVMVFRLSVRLTREIGSYFTAAADNPGRLLALAPALLAGVIAAVALTMSGGYISDNALGYSEGLATALMLVAVERHLDGRPRQAFAVGFFVALDRPEIWLFWGPYGLWLFWKDPAARKLVIALFVLIPICWFLPEYWGSGHFLRGVNRAQHPRSNSLAFAKSPFFSELTDAAWPTILLRLKLAAAVLAGVVGVVLLRGWRREGRSFLSARQPRAMGVTALAGLTGLAWFVVIATMTQIGFSGNNRYLVIGSALVDICGAVAWGWAAQEVGNVVAGLRPARSRGVVGRPGARRLVGGPRGRRTGVRLAAVVGRQQPDLDPADAPFARLPGEPAQRRDAPGRRLRGRREAAPLRDGHDRGLPGPDGRLDAGSPHDRDRGTPRTGRTAATGAERDPADARHARFDAAADRPRLASDALHVLR